MGEKGIRHETAKKSASEANRAVDWGAKRAEELRQLQGGKTFCASFCASLIAGSRRAFLCVDCVCLLLEF